MDLTVPEFSLRYALDFAQQIYNVFLAILNWMQSEPESFQIPIMFDYFKGELVYIVLDNPFPSIWSMMLGAGAFSIITLLVVRLISHFVS